MNNVKSDNGPVAVHSGQVRLTAAQAKSRMHALRPVGKAGTADGGVFDVIASIQFKAGETFGYSGEISKTGELRDAEAEALAKLEMEDRVRAQVRNELQAAYAGQLEKVRAELAAEFAESARAALEEQEARLRAEFAAGAGGKG